jgi:hypothetical protein
MRKFTRYSVLAVVVISATIAPSLAVAQNLGNGQVAFGQAAQGQNAAQVEGGILNVVNWVANVICPVVSGLFVVAMSSSGAPGVAGSQRRQPQVACSAFPAFCD